MTDFNNFGKRKEGITKRKGVLSLHRGGKRGVIQPFRFSEAGAGQKKDPVNRPLAAEQFQKGGGRKDINCQNRARKRGAYEKTALRDMRERKQRRRLKR